MEPSIDKSPALNPGVSALSIDLHRTEVARGKLRERRTLLGEALHQGHDLEHIEALLSEVDAALERINSGTYGVCEICHDSIGAETIAIDPLIRVCLEHLSERQRKEMERDLELASSMQMRLLPKNHVVHKGWEIAHHYAPAGLVSGDYCDVIISNDGAESFFLVGDVVGKGVSASFLMSQMHAIFRTLVGTLPALHDLFSRANRILTETMSSAHFATLACAAANDTNRLRIINAGHCPPILVKKGKVEELESTGVPLGLFYGADYGCNYVDLDAGDYLVLYTDGVTETVNHRDELYGSDRLTSLLSGLHGRSSREVIQKIVDDVNAFRGEVGIRDDVTIMVVKREEN